MEFSVPIPLDADGFVRRECPNCGRQFKWHDGPANEEAEAHVAPPAYHCPLCGTPAGPDSWNTREQVEYAIGLATPTIMSAVQDELAAAFRGNKFITFERGSGDDVDLPESLTEPDDMMIVASPCHSYEPVKVPEDAGSRFYCLICGEAFSV
jgi:hypothetical protein